MDGAIFRSGYEACRFAYAFSGQQYPLSVMAKIMQCVGIGSGRGLNGLDGAAIAGTVKRHVEAMPMPNPLLIASRCELNPEKARQYVGILVPEIMRSMGGGIHHRHLVRDLSFMYFRIEGFNGEKVKQAQLPDKYGIPSDAVTSVKRKVFARLRELESAAQSRIDDVMVDAGLV